MDNMPTFAVQVDPFLPDRGRNEDFRAVRSVEPEEIPITVLCVTFYELNDIAVLGSGVVARQQSSICLCSNKGLQVGVNAIT